MRKNMKKRILLFFSILSCILMVTGCSLVRENENFDKSELEAQTDAFIESWFAADFEGTVATYAEQLDETTLAQYEEYAALQKQYQGIDKKIETDFTINSDMATVNETVLCISGDKVVISLSFDKDGNIQTDEQTGAYVFNIEEYRTVGDQITTAGLNSIMSMAIVFAVLIFISFLIGCFKLIGNVQKKQPEPGETTSEVIETVTAEEENLADDLELVAVVTAAIAAASEQESTDGLVVRSIIRR